MRKSTIFFIVFLLILGLTGSAIGCQPGAEKESPPLPPQKATELTIETWEIEGSLTYSQQAIRDDILIGMVSELERGKIVRQQIIGYNLRSREQKTIFELPVDRLVYDPPAVYGDFVVWSSVDRVEEEQQKAAKRAPLPDFDVFLLELQTSKVQQLTTEEHAQVNPRIFEDTVVWLDARNVEGYYNPQRYDVYAYDVKTKTEKRLTSASTAEGRDLSINGNLVVWTDDRHADPPMDIHAGNEPGFNNEIYAYDLSTNQEKRITIYPGNDRYPVIDGENIIWLRQLHQDYIKADVFLYKTVTGKEMQVSTGNYAAYYPTVNGNRVVWADARVSLGNTSGDVVMNGIQGQADIYLYDLGTKQEIKLSSTKPGDVLANPIIYGDYVVYTSVIMIGPRVYVVQLS
jgi:Tol biopolymer transport system component